MRNKFGLLSAASRSHFALNAPSSTLVPNLLFWLFNSYSSLHATQWKSATGLLFGKGFIFGAPQFGQYAQVRTHCSVQARALCEPLV